MIILTRTFLVGIRCLSVSNLTYCTISTSSRGWRTSWSFALSSRDAHTPRWRRVKVERQQPCFLARDWYESVSSGPKVSSSARASSSGIVVLSYGGVQSRRQFWWGVHYAPVCTTRPCTLPVDSVNKTLHIYFTRHASWYRNMSVMAISVNRVAMDIYSAVLSLGQ